MFFLTLHQLTSHQGNVTTIKNKGIYSDDITDKTTHKKNACSFCI